LGLGLGLGLEDDIAGWLESVFSLAVGLFIFAEIGFAHFCDIGLAVVLFNFAETGFVQFVEIEVGVTFSKLLCEMFRDASVGSLLFEFEAFVS
jgi:hypothetical protein